ncbi:MAG: formylglycine-generating enzyme family protein, partial [Candidatus Krumholzibacteria bacterium]|nr:formylglycine-generating enzyme family protein [Candidatus Krumholzibacteria bacterium]
RGPLSTIVTMTLMLVALVTLFGCSNDDPATPEATLGTIEIITPTENISAGWHLYGPGDSFRHGDTDVVLHSMPAGQYTIIWTAVKEWTAPMPAKRTLLANKTLVLRGEYLDKAPGTNFALLSTGAFIMGSEDGSRLIITPGDPPDTTKVRAEIGHEPDEDRHHVGLGNNFYLGKTEITNQEFVELGNWAISQGHATTTENSMLDALDGSTVELINFDFPDTPIDVQEGTLRLKKPEDAARPLIEVTWYGAASFCDWLSLKEELVRSYDHDNWTINGGDVYNSTGYRLPTEAEWEYACRAGTRTAFSSGAIETGSCAEPVLDGTAWFCGNAGGSSHDVGTKAANSWGLFDMHGNVWEWCNDYYGKYEVPEPDPDNPDEIIYVIDPVGPDEGENRVVRSGRWLLSSTLCRSAGRMMATPEYRGINIGFRPAITEVPVQ